MERFAPIARTQPIMQLSWKFGRVAGIDLYLHASFALVLALPLLTGQGLLGVSLVASLFVCILLHELGHALMARRFGIPTLDITLYPIGGVARLSRMPRAPGAELLIALAGPAVNVGIALSLAIVLAPVGLWLGSSTAVVGIGGPVDVLRWLLGMNVLLAGFNLIPAFPMDGGRVLRALLSGRLGRLRATEVAATIGQVLAILFGLGCLLVTLTGQGNLLIQTALAAFLYLVAGAELSHVRAEEARLRPREPVGGAPPGYSWIYRGNGVWQLAPVIVLDDARLDRPFRGPRPWL